LGEFWTFVSSGFWLFFFVFFLDCCGGDGDSTSDSDSVSSD
jgi:hypothetical protein